MTFKWIAESNDGWTDESDRKFQTQAECYSDMLVAATRKMRWNVDFNDVCEDCMAYEEDGIIKTSGMMLDHCGRHSPGANWCIGYRLECHPHMIQHASYSGLYTYRIVKEED